MTYLLNIFTYYFNLGVIDNISSLKAKGQKNVKAGNSWYLLQRAAQHTGLCITEQVLRLATTTSYRVLLNVVFSAPNFLSCLPPIALASLQVAVVKYILKREI